MGNPLLDISAVVTPEYLAKCVWSGLLLAREILTFVPNLRYKLEANNQILAEEAHMPM